jgi:hypothetical protein
MSKRTEREADEKHGPVYRIESPALRKFRSTARAAGGLMNLERFYRVQYAEAVEAAVLAAQRAQLKRAVSVPKPMCASGTWHNDAESIEKAIIARHRAALAAWPSIERRKRSDGQWQSMYDAAMRAKRLRETTPEVMAAERAQLEFLKSKYEAA